VSGGRALRVGIVGYGYMGQIRHRSILDRPDLTLTGVADPAIGAADAPGVRLFRSHEELLDAGVDLLFVCTPPRVTPGVVIDALTRGSHVFAEKPPGRSVSDVRRIIEVERGHPELKLAFGFNHRHHLSIRDASAIIRGGSLGRILWMRGVYGKSGGPGFAGSWRNRPDESGGGILLDQGIHMLDLFCFFAGDFDEVHGMIQTSYWDIDVEDNAFVLLRNGAGQIAQLHSSATLWRHTFRLEIGLEDGYLVASGILSRSGTYGRESLIVGRRAGAPDGPRHAETREETVHYDVDPSWDAQLNEFVRCILEDRPVTDSTSADALRVMRIIERVYRQGVRAKEAVVR
jgi:predicted dehydrogenase